MKQGSGIPVSAGVAIGPAIVYRKRYGELPTTCGNPSLEQELFAAAVMEAKNQLIALYEKATLELGQEEAAIVEVQMLLLDDLDFLEGTADLISHGVSAAKAALDWGEMMAQDFSSMDDEYMKARATDIRDVSQRVGAVLSGGSRFQLPEGKFILVAEDLAPSETIQLPREQIMALVTRKGSPLSHTAILARTLNIPSLVQVDVDLQDVENCKILAVDGTKGIWYMDPDADTLAELKVKQDSSAANKSELEHYRRCRSVTKSGKNVQLCANIGSPADAQIAIKEGAEGIGLLRSEFLYLGRSSLPSEEELFEAYREVAVTMKDRPLTVRTLDIGSDKKADYLKLPMEENPALGLRGLRLCLEHDDILRSQLRAVYRASAYGNISIMFPFVASVWELRRAKAICKEIKQELASESVVMGEVPVGIMIETPAAAIMAEKLADEADFFSVGTNDLTQYTLAVDRMNAELSRFYDPYHPAVLELMAHVAKCAESAGIWAGVCGELAADPAMTDTLLQMGFTELSVAPGNIPLIRKQICESEV